MVILGRRGRERVRGHITYTAKNFLDRKSGAGSAGGGGTRLFLRVYRVAQTATVRLLNSVTVVRCTLGCVCVTMGNRRSTYVRSNEYEYSLSHR